MKKKTKRKKSEKRDANETAFSIMQKVAQIEAEGKNPAAVALGRLGGLRGGKARAATLSPDRRREIALKAAATRWRKK
jgi:hypothetical protein